jgi:DNA-binding MarR family transcriptional regulator
MEMIYDAKNCRYDVYARNAKEEGELCQAEREEIEAELKKLDLEDRTPVSDTILELFRRNDVLRPQDIMDMTAYDKLLVNARIKVFVDHNFVKRTRSGLSKLPKFIEYLDE